MTTPSSFDPFTTFVQFQDDGRARPVKWTADFWRTLGAGTRDRVVGAKHGVRPTDFHPDQWEMHPGGDELLYLLTGAVDVILEESDGDRVVNLREARRASFPGVSGID
jgi:hypothetical protein